MKIVAIGAAVISAVRALAPDIAMPNHDTMGPNHDTMGPNHDTMGEHGMGMTQRLSGMPLQAMPEMFIGFAAIAGLIALSPRIAPAGYGRISTERRILKIAALTAALVIDTSKTSTLGFVLPGMKHEYGLSNLAASGLSVAGLAGTATGAFLVRATSGHVDRSRIYLLAALGFMMTSCCAMMPTFEGNLIMCYLMGVTVGGLAPLVVASIRDLGGTSAAGMVIFASAVATAAGFLVAAGTSAVFEPTYGWRIMWLIGIPTGLALIPLSRVIGRNAVTDRPAAVATSAAPAGTLPARRPATIALFAFAFITGLTGFALSVWTPTLVEATDAPNPRLLLVVVAAFLLVAATGLAAVQIFAGQRGVLGATAGVTGAALCVLAASAVWGLSGVAAVIALLLALFGSNAMASIVLPVAAERQSVGRRTQFTAEVSIANRIGGLLGPPLLATIVVSVSATYFAVAVVGGICCILAVVSASRISATSDVRGTLLTEDDMRAAG